MDSLRALLLAMAFALLCASCADASGADTTGTPAPPGPNAPTATPEVRIAPVGGVAKPPPASATSGGTTVPLGLGTYCWSEPGKSGVCADAIGPVTATQPLTVARGATITVANPVAGSAVNGATLTAWSGLGSRPIQGTEQVWLLNGGTSATLAASSNATGLTFSADLPPGRYVIDIGLTYPQGGVSYGLLLDVR
jgi:hypothetical protein